MNGSGSHHGSFWSHGCGESGDWNFDSGVSDLITSVSSITKTREADMAKYIFGDESFATQIDVHERCRSILRLPGGIEPTRLKPRDAAFAAALYRGHARYWECDPPDWVGTQTNMLNRNERQFVAVWDHRKVDVFSYKKAVKRPSVWRANMDILRRLVAPQVKKTKARLTNHNGTIECVETGQRMNASLIDMDHRDPEFADLVKGFFDAMGLNPHEPIRVSPLTEMPIDPLFSVVFYEVHQESINSGGLVPVSREWHHFKKRHENERRN